MASRLLVTARFHLANYGFRITPKQSSALSLSRSLHRQASAKRQALPKALIISGQQEHSDVNDQMLSKLLVPFLFAALASTGLAINESQCDKDEENFASEASVDKRSSKSKIYRRSEIAQHTTRDKGIWVTYKDGVYDITKYIVNHPGGQEKIALAAGGSVEPFWSLYRQHYNSKLPIQYLEPLRIGTLHPEDLAAETEAAKVNASDPYSSDPLPSPVQKVLQKRPLNSETPGTLLADSWLTPNDLW
jgi:cytochrome b involved in lipid metabolism